MRMSTRCGWGRMARECPTATEEKGAKGKGGTRGKGGKGGKGVPGPGGQKGRGKAAQMRARQATLSLGGVWSIR